MDSKTIVVSKERCFVVGPNGSRTICDLRNCGLSLLTDEATLFNASGRVVETVAQYAPNVANGDTYRSNGATNREFSCTVFSQQELAQQGILKPGEQLVLGEAVIKTI